MENIVGQGNNGNPKLEDITIVRGDNPNENENSFCKPGNQFATLHDASPKNPQLVLCDLAFKTQSIIDVLQTDPMSGLTQPKQDFCRRYFRDQSNVEQQVLGGPLICEYTKYEAVVGQWPKTRDYRYGAAAVQQFNKESRIDALLNADSYHYFATEFYWARNCKSEPRILYDQFSAIQTQKIESGFDDAILMVNVLLGVYKNEKELFMSVYDKYFPRSSSNGGEPDNVVMGWSSSSYMSLKNINTYSSGLPKMKLTLLYISPISRDLPKYRRSGE